MELLGRYLLRALEAYESEHASGPTVAELADEIGIPPDLGHHYLFARLQRQITLGRISYFGRRLQLTEAGRDALLFDEWGPVPPLSERVSEPARAAP